MCHCFCTGFRYFSSLFILLASTFFVPERVTAQAPFGVPPSLKLKQINTDTVRIIYPTGWEVQAQRVAGLSHYLAKNKRSSIGNKHRKLELVIQNHTTISNGYVALAPFRSEFFATPFQNSNAIGTLNWLDALTLHEFRHALQYMNGRRGLSKFMYYLGGDYALQVPYALIPNWFYEGDAVMYETVLSKQGRGRLPAFYNSYRTLFDAGKKYSYMKAENGSFKDFVPTHYELGFMLLNHGWETYGNEFWKNVFIRNSRQAALIYGFSRAIHKESAGGGKVARFYRQAYDTVRNKWEREKALSPLSSAVKINGEEKTVTQYACPVYKNRDEWLLLKSSYRKIPAIYLLKKNGEEQKVVTPGFMIDDYFSYRNERIAWTELRVDPRWSWKNYSVLMLYDMNTKNKKQLTYGSKYFSPDISNDSRYIAVVEVSPGMKYRLLVLDAGSGHIADSLPNPENHFLTYPRWSPDDHYLYVTVRKDPDQTGVVRINRKTGAWEEVVPFSVNAIGYVVPVRDRIYFSASFNGLDNVFSVVPGEKSVQQVTSRHTGAYFPAVSASADEMAFVEMTNKGNNFCTMVLSGMAYPEVTITGLNELPTFQNAAMKYEGEDVPGMKVTNVYQTREYKKGLHLFKFHSWPLTLSPPNIGVSLLSNNVLNTAQASLDYFYNTQQRYSTYEAGFTYGGWYSLLHLRSGYVHDRVTQMNHYNETYQQLYVQLPLSYVKHMYSGTLNLSAGLGNNQVRFFKSESGAMPDNIDFTSFRSSIQFSNSRMRAYQHILPHFAQQITVSYNKSISKPHAEQMYARLHLIFRGLWPNHNFTLETAYQQAKAGIYSFADPMMHTRGHGVPPFEQVYRISANYHFPFIYPDTGIPGIIYLKRARTNLFYDYSEAFFSGATKNYISTGLELLFDSVFFSNAEFPVGVRFSWLLSPVDPAKPYAIEPLITFPF